MVNRTIKLAARGAGVPLWKLAEELKLSESTLFRRLRQPLSREEEQQYLAAIENAKEGGADDKQ